MFSLLFVGLFVCLLTRLLTKLLTDFHDIRWMDEAWGRIRYIWDGSESGYRVISPVEGFSQTLIRITQKVMDEFS